MRFHPYRSIELPNGARPPGRAWGEVDAEVVALLICGGLVTAGFLGHCDQTGTTIGLLGLLTSLCSIGGWLRRGGQR